MLLKQQHMKSMIVFSDHTVAREKSLMIDRKLLTVNQTARWLYKSCMYIYSVNSPNSRKQNLVFIVLVQGLATKVL